jgi:hypothetical protein
MRQTKLLKTFLLIICVFTLFFGAAVDKADATLRFYDGFEAGVLDTTNNWSRHTDASNYSVNAPINVVTNKAAKGARSLKIGLVYSSDNKTYRNQILACNGDGNPSTPCSNAPLNGVNALYLRENGVNWIGFSTYHPGSSDGAEYWVQDTQTEQLFQIHTPPFWDANGWPQGPAVSMETGDWHEPWDLLGVQTDTPLYKVVHGSDGKEWTFSYAKGVWVNWVIAYEPSDSYLSGGTGNLVIVKNGTLKIWRNGALIVDDVGANTGFPLNIGNSWLDWGIYKRPWQKAASSVSKRTMYFDEIRVGDTDSSYAEVDPTQGPPQCNDGIDNDGDGKTDYSYTAGAGDSGCTLEYGDNSESNSTTPPVCASFTYSSWGACQTNNTQTRTVISSSPAGCNGGNPVLTQGCVYFNPADINQDTKINIQDIQIVVKVITGTLTNSRADVNGDGVTNIKDIQAIVRAIIGG